MTPRLPSRPERMLKPAAARGFSLVELAVVLVIIGVLLGGLLIPVSSQLETNRRNETDTRLSEIHDALLGFAARTGRLPCPATAASNGLSAPNAATTGCTTWHGFVPVRTLGLNLAVDDNTRPTDGWLNPYRYSVTSSDGGAYTNVITLGLTPDFEVCEDAACLAVLADNVVAVVFSTGEDGTVTTSPDQLENLDGDSRFVTRMSTETAGSEFNDQVTFVSPNTLIYHLVRAGQIN